jgi:hypothetical protein
MVEKILQQAEKLTIAIISDHGLTALSRLVEAKHHTWTDISHEGRYAEVTSADAQKSDSEYLKKDTGGKHYRVALTHASFDKKPVRETHGGATPEEVLVPFIVITNTKNKTAAPTTRQDATSSLFKSSPSPLPEQQKQTAKGGYVEEDLF